MVIGRLGGELGPTLVLWSNVCSEPCVDFFIDTIDVRGVDTFNMTKGKTSEQHYD